MFTQLIIITNCRENSSVRVAVLVKFFLRLYEQKRCSPLAQREYCMFPILLVFIARSASNLTPECNKHLTILNLNNVFPLKHGITKKPVTNKKSF